MNEAHMLHVLRVAREVRAGKKYFQHTTWFRAAGMPPKLILPLQPACLGGHMCFDAEFKRLGLRIMGGANPIPLWGPKGDEWMSDDALANLLGLNEIEAKFIFGEADEIHIIDDRLQHELIEASIDNCIWRIERVIAGEFANEGTWVQFRFG